MTDPTTRHLRKFGLTVGGVFLLLGTVSWWREHDLAPRVLWGIGALLVGPGLIAPRVLAGVERAWMRMAGVLGHVNARIILTLVFLLVMTPIGAVMRCFRDPLDRRLDDDRASNWTKRADAPVDAASYERQF
jgi:hypothetical protein